MISTDFLSDVSYWIAQAKGWKDGNSDIPFGNINVIFLGDFGQLRPVGVPLLFVHHLVSKISMNQGQLSERTMALKGAHLWRLVDHVILLDKNWHHL